jgi:hypothetical protein
VEVDAVTALRSRIDEVAPRDVTLTASSRVHLRVKGSGVGRLHVGVEVRRVWGRFNEVFEIDPSRVKSITLRGLFGSVERELSFRPLHDLSRPAPARVAAPWVLLRSDALQCVPRATRAHVRVPVPSLVLPESPRAFEVKP